MKTPIRFLITLLCAATASFLVGLALLTPAHAANPPAIAWSPSTNGTFDYGAVYPPQTASQTFMLTNSGGSATGMLMVALSGSAAFTKTSDACTGTSLGPGKSCTVTVEFAPADTGKSGTGTLTATGRKPPATAGLTLTGPPNLHLSPGTCLGTCPPNGIRNYDFANGFVFGNWTQTFTITNDGNGSTGTLTTAGCCHPQFVLANNICDGQPLAASGSCTFDLTFTAPAGCNTGDEFHTPLDVLGNNPFVFYIHLTAHGFCP
jgi:hypothetical protein